MKASVRCHVHTSRSIHHGTASIGTIPGLTLSALGWVLGRKMVISYSRSILPLMMFTKAQSHGAWCAPRFGTLEPVVRQTTYFFNHD